MYFVLGVIVAVSLSLMWLGVSYGRIAKTEVYPQGMSTEVTQVDEVVPLEIPRGYLQMLPSRVKAKLVPMKYIERKEEVKQPEVVGEPTVELEESTVGVEKQENGGIVEREEGVKEKEEEKVSKEIKEVGEKAQVKEGLAEAEEKVDKVEQIGESIIRKRSVSDTSPMDRGRITEPKENSTVVTYKCKHCGEIYKEDVTDKIRIKQEYIYTGKKGKVTSITNEKGCYTIKMLEKEEGVEYKHITNLGVDIKEGAVLEKGVLLGDRQNSAITVEVGERKYSIE